MDSKVLDKLENFIDSYLLEKEKNYGKEIIIKEKIEHINRTVAIAENFWGNNRLLKVAVKYHDIGRFLQFEYFKNFDDKKILHHYLGEKIIVDAIYENKLEISEELEVIRLVILYHGRLEYMPYKKYLPEKVIEIIELVSKIDYLDNGCLGAVKYLEREILSDAKGYIVADSMKNQLMVSDEVWGFYKKGEKFDKMCYCKTYADYILFAATLAIESLKGENRGLAKNIIKMSRNNNITSEKFNTLDKYKELFYKFVEDNKAQKAYEILLGFYNDKHFEFIDK